MNVFNLTDVSTPLLVAKSLSGVTLVVGRHLLAPGASCEVTEEQIAPLRPGLQDLVAKGALAVGNQPPAAYVMAKERAKTAPKAGG